MATATLTSKGQITVPKEVRDQLKLKTGQKFEFRVDGGQVVMRPRNTDVTKLRGIVKVRPGQRVTIEEMNETIADAWAGIGKGRA